MPSRGDIIEMNYADSANSEWFIEDEASITLEDKVMETAREMYKDTLGLEAKSIRILRPKLQQETGFDKLNLFLVSYWKKELMQIVFLSKRRFRSFSSLNHILIYKIER